MHIIAMILIFGGGLALLRSCPCLISLGKAIWFVFGLFVAIAIAVVFFSEGGCIDFLRATPAEQDRWQEIHPAKQPAE